MAPPEDRLPCHYHEKCEAEIKNLKDQQAATWKRVETNQNEMRHGLEKLSSQVQQGALKQAHHTEAFVALQNKITDWSGRIDKLIARREGDTNNALEWFKIVAALACFAIFMYWLVSTKGPTAV